MDRAVAWADREAAALREGADDPTRGRVTLGQVFTFYLEQRTPSKSEKAQKSDKRNVELFGKLWGRDRDPHAVSLREWEAYVAARRRGSIDARGGSVSEERRRPVRDRVLEASLRWVNAVFNWATRWKPSESAPYLMRENPVRGYAVPREKNPRRGTMTQDRHEKMLRAARTVMMDVRVKGKRKPVPSYPPTLLAIANGEGRRITSILALQASDLHLERTESAPYGAITWRPDTDKEGYKYERVPMSAETRAAVDALLAERPVVGSAPLFPSPKNPEKPVTKDLAVAWFRKAEQAPGFDMPPMPAGRCFHAYRAKFATETRHLPYKDRMVKAGWRSDETLRRVYEQADAEGILRTITERRELREAR